MGWAQSAVMVHQCILSLRKRPPKGEAWESPRWHADPDVCLEVADEAIQARRRRPAPPPRAAAARRSLRDATPRRASHVATRPPARPRPRFPAQVNGEDDGTWLIRADALLRLGRKREAKEAEAKAKQLRPRD